MCIWRASKDAFAPGGAGEVNINNSAGVISIRVIVCMVRDLFYGWNETWWWETVVEACFKFTVPGSVSVRLGVRIEVSEVEKVVDSANLVRRKYSEKPGLAENIWNKTKKMSFFSAKLFKIVKFKQNIGDKSISIHKQATFWLKCL